MKSKWFVVDAETDGLYGRFLSIAVAIVDEFFQIIDQYYIGIDKEKLNIQDSWTRENVLPIMGNYDSYQNEDNLLEAFWEIWLKYRDLANAIGDVIYPVEARLFQRCVEVDLDNRKFLGPFPFFDLSSILLSNGINPNVDRRLLVDEELQVNQHNALDDVYMTVNIMKKLMEER